MESRVYLIREEWGPLFKVGVSVDIGKRLKTLQVGNPHKIDFYLHYEFNDNERAYDAEFDVLRYVDKCKARIQGEWFDTRIVNISAIEQIIDCHYEEDWANKATASKTYRTGIPKGERKWHS